MSKSRIYWRAETGTEHLHCKKEPNSKFSPAECDNLGVYIAFGWLPWVQTYTNEGLEEVWMLLVQTYANLGLERYYAIGQLQSPTFHWGLVHFHSQATVREVVVHACGFRCCSIVWSQFLQ